MNGYLIAEEGPLAGAILTFEEESKKEWVLGRDPDTSDWTLEDPMVSRRHVIIRQTPEGFILENLSSVNPAMQNGKIIADPVLLREGDIIQIGNTFFRFTENRPSEEPKEPPLAEEPSPLPFGLAPETRWLLKVISGPNAGAEFSMQRASSYVLGKDPNICDIVFQDLSVSRQHARLSVDNEDHVFIEDLSSRNGVIVNGELASGKKELGSEDLVGLGTTSFLIIDRLKARETIVSPPSMVPLARPAPPQAVQEASAKAPPKDWREMVIPKKHIVLAAIFGCLMVGCLIAMVGLFRPRPIVAKEYNEGNKIEEALERFPGVQYSFNETTGKLFVMGHVLTSVEKQELAYLLKNMAFIHDIDDNVIIDEYVWQNMNAVLMTYPDWVGVSVYSASPGKFVLRGYLKTVPQLEALSDYMNLNFPYLDRLENQVVVESNLQTQIQSELIAHGLAAGVAFQLSNGEIVLTGRADRAHNDKLLSLLPHIKALPGVRVVKNFVVVTTEDMTRTDISEQYPVTGFSKRDEKEYFVVIGGRIIGMGDTLDGMKVTGVKSNLVLLEKDGVKYKINYNLQ